MLVNAQEAWCVYKAIGHRVATSWCFSRQDAQVNQSVRHFDNVGESRLCRGH